MITGITTRPVVCETADKTFRIPRGTSVGVTPIDEDASGEVIKWRITFLGGCATGAIRTLVDTLQLEIRPEDIKLVSQVQE